MLGTIFALLGFGVYKTYEAGSISSDNFTSEQNSKRKGLPYYIDNKGKCRVVGTGRLCTWIIKDGGRVLQEYGTGRIIIDSYADYLREQNERLEKEGKKYYLVRRPGYAEAVKFERETNRAYKFYLGSLVMIYAKGDEWKNGLFMGETKKLSDNWDEAKLYC